MKIKISRREMLEALGGGLGVFGLAGAFAGLSRSDVHAAGLGNYMERAFNETRERREWLRRQLDLPNR